MPFPIRTEGTVKAEMTQSQVQWINVAQKATQECKI